MKKLRLDQLSVCNKLEKVAILIGEKHTWNEVNFIEEWLKSNTLSRLAEEDETLVCQSKYYIFHDIEGEINLQEKATKMRTASIGWFMYLCMYWIYMENVKPQDIAKNYDVETILTQYDVLHTESVRSAINYIKENYTKAGVIKDKLHQKAM